MKSILITMSLLVSILLSQRAIAQACTYGTLQEAMAVCAASGVTAVGYTCERDPNPACGAGGSCQVYGVNGAGTLTTGGNAWKYCAVTCHAGTSKSGGGYSSFQSDHIFSNGETVCAPDGCEAHWQDQHGNNVDMCMGLVCTNSGTMSYTGNQCSDGSGGFPPLPPSPDDNPPPCAGQDCYKPPDQVCNAESGDCVTIPQPPNLPNGCSAGDQSELCVGNPPPTPPAPPDGPCGSNATSSTQTGMSTLAGTFSATSYDPCPPPPPGNNCPAGTYKDGNGNCQQQCPSGQTFNGTACVGTCPAGQMLQNGVCGFACPAGQVLQGTQCVSVCPGGQIAVNGVCQNSCPAGQTPNGDGTCSSGCPSGQIWANGSCTSSSGGCPSGQTLNTATKVCEGTCPAGSVMSNGVCQSSCPPGQTQQDGKCQAGNSDSGGTDCGSQPSCSGDQILCNIDYQAWQARCMNKTQGGGDCTAPPTCTGDQALCNIDMQAWNQRCQNKVTAGTTCDAPPVCTGDAAACAAVRNTWTTACALTPDDSKTPTDAMIASAPAGGEGGASDPDVAQVVQRGDDITEDIFDQSGFIGSGDCPQIGPLSVLGHSYTILQVHCDVLDWVRALLMISAYLVAIRIVARTN